MKKYLRGLGRLTKAMAKDPAAFAKAVQTVPAACEAHRFSQGYTDSVREAGDGGAESSNPLWEYFRDHKEGHGIWKWEHYFDIYHRHFARFVGEKVNVLEIGVFSGGNLEMWRSYFGEGSHIYGVDIEEACTAYENEHTSIFIGDQEDRAFWKRFKESAPGIDILVDDGGHTPEQQQVTLEEMLPSLNPGGVYLCEDIVGSFNRFSAFAAGLADELNSFHDVPGGSLQSEVSSFQSSIYSMHFYPYVTVIEKRRQPLDKLAAPRHGTQWQPFL